MFNKKTSVEKETNLAKKNIRKNARNKSLSITLIYEIVGSLWIIFTDNLVGNLFGQHNNVSTMVTFSIMKGLLYVLITSALIYLITYSKLIKILNSKEEINRSNKELEKSNLFLQEINKELESKDVLIRSLLNSIPDLMFFKDNDFKYIGCNQAFEEFVGKTEKEIIGRTDFELFDAEVAQKFRNNDIEMLRRCLPKSDEEIITYTNGNIECFETMKSQYYDSNGNISGLIGVSRNITERKKKEEEIFYLSQHDVLTGLYNRSHYHMQLEKIDHKEFMPISIIYGDVNGMKLINDAFGHVEGDKILIETSTILKQFCRNNDIICRVGGDEFSIILPNTDNNTVKSIVENIRLECSLRKQNENIINVDIALGFATKSNINESLKDTIIFAEDLMYRHKLLESQSLHSSLLSSIKATMFEKSNETEEHAERLALLSKELGRKIGLTEETLDELELVAELHDLGKISIDKNILTKAGELTAEEWHEIKKHPEVGYRIANSLSELKHIAVYILSHHERWDGHGYPQGLSGEKIPLLSRIVSIVDTYDAITHDRAYRKAMSKEEALEEIKKNAGTQFDPALVALFAGETITNIIGSPY